jgi:competence ComEA-like helix-hairpin-helix protein
MMRTTIAVLMMLALCAGAAAAQTPETLVNLNTATVQQLETLPGVGPATAQRIVEYRQKSGGFKKIDAGVICASSCTGDRDHSLHQSPKVAPKVSWVPQASLSCGSTTAKQIGVWTKPLARRTLRVRCARPAG